MRMTLKSLNRAFARPFDPEEVDRNIQDCIQRITQRKFEEKRLAALSQEPDDVALHNLLLKEKRKLIRGAHP